MQNRILAPGPVLTDNGTLAQRGYSTEAVLDFNRNRIKAPPWRIKEWDFYQVSNDDYCLQMTIGHVSYAGDVSVKLFEYATGKRYDYSVMLLLPFGRLNMPPSADAGDLAYRKKGMFLSFQPGESERRLTCRWEGGRQPPLEIDVTLSQRDRNSIVMATPFDERETFFYYNHKISCMPASGFARIGEQEYRFEPDSSFGLLDWGRGVWPFSHEWFWGSGSGHAAGKRFGFNIGFGFGNTAAATENMLFYDGKAHKLGRVDFDLAGSGGYLAPKKFTSDDGRFEMDFVPVYDRCTETKLLKIHTSCHQIFGRFSGCAVLDDGERIEVKDLMAFAEHAVNRW
ncbi:MULTISPECIES: DUF2804 domain-containing protein [unclassified Paenibacillus]|uniref:DUF2804 domain-containing protein n=1 Tax=unclassified Paenibacillus TaxID=185978 RepID=UPI00095486CF|nr:MULTISPECIES: DUF2804 domain-containing protein [unclassified Paenibacillus]ASS64786.1 DUF2804 domain-containing protein [Paenibacillus sp. RUD330]SIR06053.1 Protein of unknown function [Paenibacillus sp. RU4X]SIR29409.1 Protein of unknown function [Paenibacillus sp. RU4T]